MGELGYITDKVSEQTFQRGGVIVTRICSAMPNLPQYAWARTAKTSPLLGISVETTIQ